ncbi:MAG: carbohydrate-binding domain-containing protein, partial [Olsenella sp.]|nr:carbohydrate-binding domain-containing protein [Olsenella sp.]
MRYSNKTSHARTNGHDTLAGSSLAGTRPTRFSRMPRRLVAVGLAATLAASTLAGCSQAAVSSTSGTSESTGTSTTQTASATVQGTLDTSDMFSKRDLDASFDKSSAATVTLADGATTSSSSAVKVDGNTVTITAEGTYVLSGALSDGRIVVDAGESAKVQIVLSGASVTSSSAAAVYVRSADKVFVTLADGTTSSVVSTGAAETTDDHTLDGAIFSTSDLTVNGGGTLTVMSAQGNGIVGKDDVVLANGTVSVEAAGHAVQANDSIRVAGGTWSLKAGVDGLHAANDSDATLGYIYVADGTINATTTSDGLDAGYILQVDGGTIAVSAGDDGLHAEQDLIINDGVITVSQSNEGLEGARVWICGGTQSVTATDDGVNASGDPSSSANGASPAAGGQGSTSAQGGQMPSGQMPSGEMPSGEMPSGEMPSGEMPSGEQRGMGGGMGGGQMGSDSTATLTVSGGTLTVNAGGDGLDSNGDLVVTGGEVYVSGPTDSGNGAIDTGDQSEAKISGGTVIALGSSGMAVGFGSSSTQGSALVSASGSAGDEVVLSDTSGNVLARYTAAKAFSCVVVSAPGMQSGGTYTLSVAGESHQFTLDGLTYSDVAGGMGG